MNTFKDIISEQEFFTYTPDCVADGNSYQKLIENAFELTGGLLNLDQFDWQSTADELQFKLVVNGAAHQFAVDIIADYVDGPGIITGFNQILRDTGYAGHQHFCDIDGGVADFGIAFITSEQEAELAGHGLILRPQTALAMS